MSDLTFTPSAAAAFSAILQEAEISATPTTRRPVATYAPAAMPPAGVPKPPAP